MSITFDAVYENGVLRPIQPLALQEQEQVRVTVEPRGERSAKTETVENAPEPSRPTLAERRKRIGRRCGLAVRHA